MEGKVVENLLDTLLGKLKDLVDSETVVGKPIDAGKATIIPVTKITFGFGAGGGKGKDNGDSGTGTGGGAVIEPVAIITVEDESVRVQSLKGNNITKVVEMVPEVLKKISKNKESRKESAKS